MRSPSLVMMMTPAENMKCLILFFSVSILHSNAESTAYQNTQNLSDSSWIAAIKHSKIANSFLICAGYCQFQQSKTGYT